MISGTSVTRRDLFTDALRGAIFALAGAPFIFAAVLGAILLAKEIIVQEIRTAAIREIEKLAAAPITVPLPAVVARPELPTEALSVNYLNGLVGNDDELWVHNGGKKAVRNVRISLLVDRVGQGSMWIETIKIELIEPGSEIKKKLKRPGNLDPLEVVTAKVAAAEY